MNASRVERIRQTLDKAEKLEGDAEALKWKAAKDIWEEVQSGTKQKDLAKAIRKSVVTVNNAVSAYRLKIQDPEFSGSYGDAVERAGLSQERIALIEDAAAEKGVGFGTAARALRGWSVEPTKPPSVEQVKKAMKDPDTAFKVMAEPEVAKVVNRAAAERWEQAAEDRREKFPAVKDAEKTSAASNGIVRVNDARRKLKEATEFFSQAGDLATPDRDELEHTLGIIEMQVDELHRVARGQEITPEDIIGRR